ncbi:MAG TPA: Tol-Pal system beta propeller repeat protein TolB [Caulobacteraceae bacterium]|jgi:TolB protein
MRWFAVWVLMLLSAATIAAAPAPARAQIEIDINEANLRPMPIAIPTFGGGQQGGDITRVISANLDRSGLFRPLDPARLPPVGDLAVEPAFGAWRSVGAEAMLQGAASIDPDGRLRVDFRLWDVASGQQLVGAQFTSTPDNWRRTAHKISDAVYERLTGEKGYFDTRVVFVAESGKKVNREKRLAIMDQDGANPSFLTDGSYVVLNPRFSPVAQEITYMALKPSGSAIYVFNIETGRQETIGEFPGQVFAPRFAPDGRRVIFSLATSGNSDIYEMDLRTRTSRRIVGGPAIDTSPSYSPDGQRIVFNSDRGGSPQLYVMDANGANVRRASFGSGRYTNPVWSPKGDFIAFTKQVGGRFQIGVMRPDGSGERTLTSSSLEEGPTWAPNGRVLMFQRDTSEGPRLWMVDVTGRVLRPVPYPHAASDPAWSPLLG